jgi:hypothetical protein
MSDPRDYNLDVSGVTPVQTGGKGSGAARFKPYLSVRFACCGVYQRVYRDADGRRYRGRCPRCARAVTFAVGAGGTTARYFVVS